MPTDVSLRPSLWAFEEWQGRTYARLILIMYQHCITTLKICQALTFRRGRKRLKIVNSQTKCNSKLHWCIYFENLLPIFFNSGSKNYLLTFQEKTDRIINKEANSIIQWLFSRHWPTRNAENYSLAPRCFITSAFFFSVYALEPYVYRDLII